MKTAFCLTTSVLVLVACVSPQSASELSILEPAAEAPLVEPALDGYTLPYRSEKPKILLIGPIVDSSEDCGSFNTQVEMNLCAKRNVDMTSEQLAQVRSWVVDSLTDEGKTSLSRSDTAWEEFQALECRFATVQSAGGSIEPLIYGSCLSRHNLARTRELAGEGQASLSYAEADAQLNESYQGLVAVLSEPRVEALADVQLAWIEYRDRHCAYEADYSPTFSGTEDQCLARVSKLRAVDLAQAARQNNL